MAGKTPRPACVEEFDEDAQAILPESRQVANTAAKVTSRLDLRLPAEPPLIDGASDSGYSSRTAATGNSTQSGPSGGKSPPGPLKLDMPKRTTDLARKGSSRRDRKEKERVRPVRDEKMVGAYTASAHHQAHVHRSPSKSHRRDSSRVVYPESYYEGASAYYPPSTPVEAPLPPRPMDFSSQYAFRPPIPDYIPSSPQHASRYPPGVIEQYHSSRHSGRPSRSNSYYHQSGYHAERPVSWAMGSPHPSYEHSMYAYDTHGPPPSSSAYSNVQYSSSPYGGSSYCPPSEYALPPEYTRERSASRTREPSRHRRASVYEAPLEPEMFPFFDEGEPLERWYSRERREPREPRDRGPVKPLRDYEEDARQEDARRRMPPPPPPAPKPRSAPQVHQVRRPEARKSQTTTAIPSQRRPSRAMDMSELSAVLPECELPREYEPRRVSREAWLPERSNSLRERSTSYHDSARGASVAVETSRRRRAPTKYYYEEPGSTGDLEYRAAQVERYQDVKSGRSTAALPASEEAMLPKLANGTGSDAGSQKSRSNSSRGSGSGSKADGENKNMTLSMNGISIALTEESVAGKNIRIRTGNSGGVHLNIDDGANNRPKNYLAAGSSHSDSARGGSRQIADVPRVHSDRRSDRASRRSSRSSYHPKGY